MKRPDRTFSHFSLGTFFQTQMIIHLNQDYISEPPPQERERERDQYSLGFMGMKGE